MTRMSSASACWKGNTISSTGGAESQRARAGRAWCVRRVIPTPEVGCRGDDSLRSWWHGGGGIWGVVLPATLRDHHPCVTHNPSCLGMTRDGVAASGPRERPSQHVRGVHCGAPLNLLKRRPDRKRLFALTFPGNRDVDRSLEQPLGRRRDRLIPTPTLPPNCARAECARSLAVSRVRLEAPAAVPSTTSTADGSERSRQPNRPPVPDSAIPIVSRRSRSASSRTCVSERSSSA